MKAILINEKGPADNLYIGELPDPTPGPSEVIIKLAYAGINHGDVIRRARGIFPAGRLPPFVLGLEGAGIVAGIGTNVKKFRIGQRVAFLAESGGYAELACVPESQVFALPDAISERSAAASVCVGLTAWHLVRIANLQPAQRVLVHAGAGGVGSTLIQLCKSHAIELFTTVGSEEKARFAQELGANHVINYRTCDFADRTLELTNGKGVETIFDCIGRDVVDGNFRCLARGGQILYYGSASGHAQFPGDKILNNEARITGFVIFGTFRSPTLWQQGVEGLLQALTEGIIRMNIEELPMKDVVAAHKKLENRTVHGKMVLRI